jgi:hypothetical protein
MDVHNSYIMYYGFTIMYIIHNGINNTGLYIMNHGLYITRT